MTPIAAGAPHQVARMSAEEKNDILCDVVTSVAKRSLIELAVSAALAAICCFFVATPAGVGTILTGLAIQTLVSLAIRLYVGYHEYKHRVDPNHEPSSIAKWLGAYSFASGSANNAQVVIHEAGHKIAVNALLKNARPKITLIPYAGGMTSWRVTGELTKLGQKVNKENLQPIISAAGPLMSLGISTVLLGVGLATQDSAPEVSRMMIVSAILDFFVHATYALSALGANLADFAHDFVCLWKLGGIHPITAALAIIAVPVIMIAAYCGIRRANCYQPPIEQAAPQSQPVEFV